jgi:hypothetical protein
MEMWINVQEMYRNFLSAGIFMDVWQEVSGRECVTHRNNLCRSHKGQPLLATEELWR